MMQSARARLASATPALAALGCVFFLFACASSLASPDEVLLRLADFAKRDAALSAAVTVELKFLESSTLRGTYRASSDGNLRYVISNDTLHIDLSQSGRDLWMIMADAAVHLTPEDLTDTEYDLLRSVAGPLGVPLLSLAQMPRWIERHYVLVGTKRAGWFGDDVLVAAPRPKWRETLRSWVSFQTGIPASGHGQVAPDTIHVHISRRNGAFTRMEQLNSLGEIVSTLSMKFNAAATPIAAPLAAPLAPPQPPPARIFRNRELMMALGAGPAWLIGKSVPDARVVRLDGQKLSLSNFRGRPMLINFWATWCAPCRIELPVLRQLYDRHGKDVEFVLLSNEDMPPVRDYLQANGYRVPVYLSADALSFAGFGVRSLPSTFFVDASGMIRGVFIGFPAKETIEETRADLLNKYDRVLSDLRIHPNRPAVPSRADDS